MRKINQKIGFDDRPVMLVMIPLCAFLIPYIFMFRRFSEPPYLTWKIYRGVLVITTVIWLGNRFIMKEARTRYPKFESTRKRLLIQSLIMLLYTLFCNNLLAFPLDLCGKMSINGIDLYTLILNSNVASLLCTLTVVAIYESVYFNAALTRSVEEKERLKRESLQAQLNALKIQVNPHFLFNNLNTLSALIPEDPKQAIDFVQQLSKVYRHILEVRDDQRILLQEELDVVKAYVFLLQTRFQDNLHILINIPAEKLQRMIVPLSLQILLENAIKHNIVSSEKPLRIDISAVNGRLIVRNNLQKRNQLPESTGIGLENIRNRYSLLSEYPVEVTESLSDFIVSIPLLEN